MNNLEKAAAALALCEQTGLTKEAWDRSAWYSYIPVVGDIGNAVSNASDGNYWSAAGNLGMAALNFIPGAGLAAQGLKLGAKGLGGLAAKGIAKGVTGAGSKALTRGAGNIRGVAGRVIKNTPLGKRFAKFQGRGLNSPKGALFSPLGRNVTGQFAVRSMTPDQQQPQQPQQQQGFGGFNFGQAGRAHSSTLLGQGGQDTGYQRNVSGIL